jgi:transposase
MTVLSADALLALSKKEKNPNKRVRMLAVSLYLECHNRAQVARQLKVARRSVNNWVSEYLAHGLSGLKDKPRPGKPSALSIKQKQQLSRFIDNSTQTDKGGRLTGMHIKEYIQTEFGVDYHLSHIYKILSKLGYSWITSRSRHPKQQSGVQDAYKKVLTGNDP